MVSRRWIVERGVIAPCRRARRRAAGPSALIGESQILDVGKVIPSWAPCGLTWGFDTGIRSGGGVAGRQDGSRGGASRRRHRGQSRLPGREHIGPSRLRSMDGVQAASSRIIMSWSDRPRLPRSRVLASWFRWRAPAADHHAEIKTGGRTVCGDLAGERTRAGSVGADWRIAGNIGLVDGLQLSSSSLPVETSDGDCRGAVSAPGGTFLRPTRCRWRGHAPVGCSASRWSHRGGGGLATGSRRIEAATITSNRSRSVGDGLPGQRDARVIGDQPAIAAAR